MRISSSLRACFLLLPAILLVPAPAGARDKMLGCAYSLKELRQMSVCQLDELFASGQVGTIPVGVTRGHALARVDARHPRLRAHLDSTIWRGKVFGDDGSFINQWLGFRAISSYLAIGPSWYDGKPSIVLEYPPDSIAFANAHDELREIAPGVFLGRYYERCPCQEFVSYFVLEMKCCKN